MAVTQRKYICSFCAKAFSRSEHRIRHERSHTGYKPFQCMLCQHSFVRRDLVQRHIKTVHKYVLLNNKDVLLQIIDSLNNPIDIKNNNNNNNNHGNHDKNNTSVPSDFNIMEILNGLNINLDRKSSSNFDDFHVNNHNNNTINNNGNYHITTVTEDELLVLDKIVKFFISYKDSINESRANMKKNSNLYNKDKDKILSNVNNESEYKQNYSRARNEPFLNSLPNGTVILQNIRNNGNKPKHISDDNRNIPDRSPSMTQIDPNDINWINYINNAIFINLRNELPSLSNLKVSDFITYFNHGYKYILNYGESNHNESVNISSPSPSPSFALNTDNLLFIHYLTHSYKNLESLWGFKILNNINNNNNNNIPTGSYNNLNKTIPILPLIIVYLGYLLNSTVNYQLWNDLWLLSLRESFYNNQIEHVVATSLLIFEFIQQYSLLNEGTEEHVEIYSVSSPVLNHIFDTYQLTLFNFIQSNVDCSSMNFNKWDFNSLLLIWASFLQLFDGVFFNEISSKIYLEIINTHSIWDQFNQDTLKDLIQFGIDHLINEYIPDDLLICLPSILYLEANNNRFLNRDKMLTLGNFKSMEDLHNLIIKINQCYIQNNNNNNNKNGNTTFTNANTNRFNDALTIVNISPVLINSQLSTKSTKSIDDTISMYGKYTINDSDIWKTNLMVSVAPQRFKPIIKSYAIIPTTLSHWLLIEATWFEFIRNLSSTEYIFKKNWFLDNILNDSMFFDSKSINNNLSICSLPVILLVLTPNANYLNVLSARFKRLLPLIIDVLLIQLKLVCSELNQSSSNDKNKTGRFLLNPLIQLLLYVWYIVIYKIDSTTAPVYSQSEVDLVNSFMSKYIMNLEKHVDTDKLLEQDLDKIFFNKDAIEYMGFNHFLNRITSFIKNELLLNKVLPSPYLSQNIKFKVIEAIRIFNTDNKHVIIDQTATNNVTGKYSNNTTSTTTTTFNSKSLNFVSTDPDPNNMVSPKQNESVFLETRPVNFNSIYIPLHYLGNQHLTSPFPKRNSVSSNSNSVSKPNSSGRPSLTLGVSPISLSPYLTRRRSSVMSITDDGKNYLLPPLNFDPIQMDAPNLSSIHSNVSNETVANKTTNPITNNSNNSSIYFNEGLNSTNIQNSHDKSNNTNNSFNTLYNYSLRDAIGKSPSIEKRRASVPIIPPKSTFLTGSNSSNSINTNVNNAKNSVLLNSGLHSRIPSYKSNIFRHPAAGHPYVNTGVPSSSTLVSGPTSLSNNHILNRSAGGNNSVSTHLSGFLNSSIGMSVNDNSSATIANSLVPSEDLPEPTIPLPSPSQLFGI